MRALWKELRRGGDSFNGMSQPQTPCLHLSLLHQVHFRWRHTEQAWEATRCEKRSGEPLSFNLKTGFFLNGNEVGPLGDHLIAG